MTRQNSDILKEKLDAGAWLTLEDGLRLYESNDIHTLGELANSVRERLHGRRAYYNINLHVKIVGDQMWVHLHVQGSEMQTRLKEEWCFIAQELVVNERRRS